MTNQQNHPIAPPPELVGRWLCSEDYLSDVPTNSTMTITSSRLQNVATQAAQWGADQELEACCEVVSHWLGDWHKDIHPPTMLRAARRPKPPSLKLRIAEAIVKGDKPVALSLLAEAMPDD